MKHIITLIIAALAAFIPASAQVVIESPDNVVIDGVPAGKLVDAVLNHRTRTAELHAALAAWTAAQAAKVAAAEAAKADAQAAALDVARAAKAAAKLAEAETPEKERRKAELRSEKARIEKELAE